MPWWVRQLRQLFQSIYADVMRTHTIYVRVSSRARPMTEDEARALDAVFAKFDEGFKELDKLFEGWR